LNVEDDVREEAITMTAYKGMLGILMFLHMSLAP